MSSSGMMVMKANSKKAAAVIDAACSASTGSSYYRKDLASALKTKYAKLSTGIRVKQGLAKKGKGCKTGRK